MYSHYDYADLVLPVLVACEETKNIVNPYWRVNGICGTVTAHGDKWMGESELSELGIPRYQQITLYLLYRCSIFDDHQRGEIRKFIVQFIKEWHVKLKQYLPRFENTCVEIKGHPRKLWTRFSFDREHWSKWQEHRGISREYFLDMMCPAYWRIRYYDRIGDPCHYAHPELRIVKTLKDVIKSRHMQRKLVI